MNKETTTMLLGGIGLGAALMYILDPDRGNRRRTILLDKLTSAANRVPDAIGTTTRDLGNRARGLVAEVSSMFGSDEASDQVVEARVRSQMGRIVSHPHAIKVTLNQGHVTLSGPILAHEVDDLLSCVSSVGGVVDVDNQLDVHKEAGNVPGLQGGRVRPGDRFELMQENWSPTARLLTGAAGGALVVYGLSRRDPLSLTLSAGGLLLLARGATNIEVKRLVGLGGGRRAVEIQKAINVDAPAEAVYRFWANYENFPLFMSNVREVRDHGNGQSHWVVAGPAGVPVEWDAVITEHVPNELLAWKSVAGSTIENAGVVRFDENRDGTTRVEIRLSYNPPAGAVGHAVAALFGADPKTEMDEDLMRMKTLIETGNRPRDEAAETNTQARGATAR
jgi:uncharacterized membrane protein